MAAFLGKIAASLGNKAASVVVLLCGAVPGALKKPRRIAADTLAVFGVGA